MERYMDRILSIQNEGIQIIPIEYGKSFLPEKMIFLGGDENAAREIIFKIYVIRLDEKLIIVDAGCETMPGFVMKDFIGTIQALKNANIDPEAITDVVITHSHHDHIECVKYFKNALIHIEIDEYEAGRKYIPNNFKVNVFSDECIVDKGVKVIKIGGHSKGSCIVEIRKNDKIYVIVGDECYLKECLERNIPTGSFYNKDKSEAFIKKYSTPKYITLMCHDK